MDREAQPPAAPNTLATQQKAEIEEPRSLFCGARGPHDNHYSDSNELPDIPEDQPTWLEAQTLSSGHDYVQSDPVTEELQPAQDWVDFAWSPPLLQHGSRVPSQDDTNRVGMSDINEVGQCMEVSSATSISQNDGYTDDWWNVLFGPMDTRSTNSPPVYPHPYTAPYRGFVGAHEKTATRRPTGSDLRQVRDQTIGVEAPSWNLQPIVPYVSAHSGLQRRRRLLSDKDLERPAKESLPRLNTELEKQKLCPDLVTSTQESLSHPELATRQACERYCQEAVVRGCSTFQSRGAGAGRLSCTWGCGFSTDSRESWERHEEKRQPQQIYRCWQCLWSAPPATDRSPYIHHRKDKVLEHAQRMHRDIDPVELRRQSHVESYEAPFIRSCNFRHKFHHQPCTSMFSTWKERNDHYVAHFGNQVPAGPWYVAVDPQWNEQQCAGGSVTTSSSSASADVGSSVDLKCHCGKSFSTHSQLRHHQRYHEIRRHPCVHCDKTFFHLKDLRRHLATHDPAGSLGFSCPHEGCGGSYRRKDHLARHQRVRHGEGSDAGSNVSMT